MASQPYAAKRTQPRPTLELGEVIRDRREARRLSMQVTADQAGISAGYQFKLEGGFVRTPSPRVLHRLGAVLELPYAELMRLAGYPEDVAPDVRSVRSRDGLVAGPGDGAPAPAATGDAPTNRRVIRLLEEIRQDVVAIRDDLRRLERAQSGRGEPPVGGVGTARPAR